MTILDLKNVLAQIFETASLISAVLSGPKLPKLSIRPLMVKGSRCYQCTEQVETQAIHRNFSSQECRDLLLKKIKEYKQTVLFTTSADYQILVNKEKMKILKKPASKSNLVLEHNRQKHYLLPEGNPIPFLVELGVMNGAGKVYPQKMDKFRQMNRFIEMVDDIVTHLEPSKTVHIVDFGCGKAYLTFALYHYLKLTKGYAVKITGLDLKDDVIKRCQQLSKQLDYNDDLRFLLGDINTYETKDPVDMMVSLHACDTATDAALEKAILWQAKVILSVPCCQHELFKQIENNALTPLLKHGILKERFAALTTDAARAQLLDVVGYHTQLLEFIDMEHTPKNLLIRAVRRPHQEISTQAWEEYVRFKEALSVIPSLEVRLKARLP